jgi:hypothetical protein
MFQGALCPLWGPSALALVLWAETEFSATRPLPESTTIIPYRWSVRHICLRNSLVRLGQVAQFTLGSSWNLAPSGTQLVELPHCPSLKIAGYT